MKRILILTLCFVMLFSVSGIADAYDVLFFTPRSYSAQMNFEIETDAETIAALFPSYDDGITFFDGYEFAGGISDMKFDAVAKMNISQDYTKAKIMMDMTSVLPIRFNKNFSADALVRVAVWIDYDITDEANPRFDIVTLTPADSRYVKFDIVELMADNGIDPAEFVSCAKKYFNEQTMTRYMEEFKEIYKANSTATTRSNVSTITVSGEQYRALTEAVFEKLVPVMETITGEKMPEGADLIYYYDSSSLKDVNIVTEIISNPNGTPNSCKVTMDAAYEVSPYDEEENLISFTMTENSAFSNVNGNVQIDMPELTEANSLKFKQPSYDLDYEPYAYWVYAEGTYIPAQDDTLYIPLDSVVQDFEVYGFAYDIKRDGNVIVIKDASGTDTCFDEGVLTVGSTEILVDGVALVVPNPVLEYEGEVYVDNETLHHIFGLVVSYGTAYPDEKMQDVSLFRENPDYVEPEYDYEDDYDYEYCEHWQNLYDIEVYNGADFAYLGLRSTIASYSDSWIHGDGEDTPEFDIAYDNGVVTITAVQNAKLFNTAVVTVGSDIVTVDGADYSVTLPAVNYDGVVYVSEDVIKLLTGFENPVCTITYDGIMEYDDNGALIDYHLDSHVRAVLSRKDPLCIHTWEEIEAEMNN